LKGRGWSFLKGLTPLCDPPGDEKLCISEKFEWLALLCDPARNENHNIRQREFEGVKTISVERYHD
jgi:hypothetical protein